MEIKGRLSFILVSVAGLDDCPVDRVLRVQEVHVTGSGNRFSKVLAELDDLFVDLAKFIEVRNTPDLLPHDVLVVAHRLDLQIVVELNDLCDL